VLRSILFTISDITCTLYILNYIYAYIIVVVRLIVYLISTKIERVYAYYRTQLFFIYLVNPYNLKGPRKGNVMITN